MSDCIKREDALAAVCSACGIVPQQEKELCPYKFTGCLEYRNIFCINAIDVYSNLGEYT